MRQIGLTLTLSASLLLCSCHLTMPGSRTTHQDRWQRATARFEADLVERRAAGTLAGAPVREAARPQQVLRVAGGAERPVTVYDVQDLVAGVPSFSAPELGLVSPSGGLEQEPLEVTRTAHIDPALLEELVRSGAAPGTWDDEGNSVEVVDGRLIVRRR